MISDDALAAIAERLKLWIEFRDLDSLRDDDLRDLLGELRTMRRQHTHDVALLTSCRQRYAALDTEYRDLASRYGIGDRRADLAERDGLAADADEAQTAAEIGEAP
jgi:hypothetical protein